MIDDGECSLVRNDTNIRIVAWSLHYRSSEIEQDEAGQTTDKFVNERICDQLQHVNRDKRK